MSNHTYTKKIGGDSIDLFLVFQIERETVMTITITPLIIISERFNRKDKNGKLKKFK